MCSGHTTCSASIVDSGGAARVDHGAAGVDDCCAAVVPLRLSAPDMDSRRPAASASTSEDGSAETVPFSMLSSPCSRLAYIWAEGAAPALCCAPSAASPHPQHSGLFASFLPLQKLWQEQPVELPRQAAPWKDTGTYWHHDGTDCAATAANTLPSVWLLSSRP